MLTFKAARSAEGPTWTALLLIFHFSDIALKLGKWRLKFVAFWQLLTIFWSLSEIRKTEILTKFLYFSTLKKRNKNLQGIFLTECLVLEITKPHWPSWLLSEHPWRVRNGRFPMRPFALKRWIHWKNGQILLVTNLRIRLCPGCKNVPHLRRPSCAYLCRLNYPPKWRADSKVQNESFFKLLNIFSIFVKNLFETVQKLQIEWPFFVSNSQKYLCFTEFIIFVVTLNKILPLIIQVRIVILRRNCRYANKCDGQCQLHFYYWLKVCLTDRVFILFIFLCVQKFKQILSKY